MLEVQRKPRKLFIGIPKESTYQENRVAIVPSSVASFIHRGHRVMVEREAGEKSNYTDNDYSEAGADIAHSREEVFKADVLIKVAPLTLDEIELLRPNQIVITPLYLPGVSAEYLNLLRQKRVTALAMEYIKDDIGQFPIVRIMSELAGISAAMTASELLSKPKGKGVLLAGISGVPSAKVIILGAGVVAEFAARAVLGLGAEVRIFDNNIYKLMRLQHQLGRQVYTSAINPFYLKQELYSADVVIGAIHSKTGRTPVIVSEEMVMNMKPGSVIIDVSIDQGGCFATSRMTTHQEPTFVEHDIIHYCVPNIPSRVPRTASIAISNILTPLLLSAEHTGSISQLIHEHAGLRHGVYTFKGCLTNRYLGERFQIKTTDLDLLLTSDL